MEGAARACFGIEECARYLDRTLALDPGRGEVLIDLARQHAMAKQYKKAEAMIQRHLGLDPAPPTPMRAYATFCAANLQRMQGDTQASEALLAEAKKLDPACWTFFRQPHHALFAPP